MKGETWALLTAVFVLLFVGGLCGFFIKGCTEVKPLPLVSHTDTLRIKADTVRIPEKHYYPLPKDTITNEVIKYPKLTIADSLQGTKEGIGYNLSVRASIDSLGIVWDWKTQFIPPDAIRIFDTTYVPTTIEVPLSWYKDGWAYSTFGLFFLSVLYLIGIL